MWPKDRGIRKKGSGSLEVTLQAVAGLSGRPDVLIPRPALFMDSAQESNNRQHLVPFPLGQALGRQLGKEYRKSSQEP